VKKKAVPRSKRKLRTCLHHQLVHICYSFKKISKGCNMGSLFTWLSCT